MMSSFKEWQSQINRPTQTADKRIHTNYIQTQLQMGGNLPEMCDFFYLPAEIHSQPRLPKLFNLLLLLFIDTITDTIL